MMANDELPRKSLLELIQGCSGTAQDQRNSARFTLLVTGLGSDLRGRSLGAEIRHEYCRSAGMAAGSRTDSDHGCRCILLYALPA